jgi:gas vesicle protein
MAVVDREWASHPESETSAGVKPTHEDPTKLLNAVNHTPALPTEPHVSEVAPEPLPTPSKHEAGAKFPSEEELDRKAKEKKEETKQAIKETKEDVKQSADKVKEDVKEGAKEVKKDVKDAAQKVKQNLPADAEEAGARAGRAIDEGVEKAKDLGARAEQKAKKVGAKAEATAEELAADVRAAAANAGDKAAELSRDAEKKAKELKKQAGEKLERAETVAEKYLSQAMDIILRPGTLGGLMGVANVGLLGTLGYYAYTRRNIPWNRNYVAAAAASTLSLFATEGVVAERYSTTPEGKAELLRAKQEGSRAYIQAKEIVLRPQVAGGALGVLNVAVLGVREYRVLRES